MLPIFLPAVASLHTQPAPSSQRHIRAIDSMPRMPRSLIIPDWRQKAVNYTQFVFDPASHGPFLPVLRLPNTQGATFFLPSYLGGGGPEGVDCLAAVVTGALSGTDMTRFRGHDWVKMCQAYFDTQDGIYTNNPNSQASGSFWYDLLPGILACQISSFYPASDVAAKDNAEADRWAQAVTVMAGGMPPPAVPDFDHSGFRFETMKPVNNGTWTEPDSAAGIGWLEYMAYARTGQKSYLDTARQCLTALVNRPDEKNPLYEVLLPYGTAAAARSNAESGGKYDLDRLLNWCLSAGDNRAARPGWGAILSAFGSYDAYGLIGSVTDTEGYAFAMNSFEWAGTLAPVARYDPRYASALGKWLLNVLSASRLFYPQTLTASHQDDRTWPEKYDPNGALPYEGVRQQALRFSTGGADVSNQNATVTGSAAALSKLDGQVEQISAGAAAGARAQHVWRMSVKGSGRKWVEVYARVRSDAADHGFLIEWSSEPGGTFTRLFDVKETGEITWHSAPIPDSAPETIYLRATASSGAAQTLDMDQIRGRTQDATVSPYATGDALGWGGPSNLCLYGGSHVGLLGALAGRTSDPAIPAINLLATDWFHTPAWPTFLLYNPHDTATHVTLPLGTGSFDVYDSVSHRFLLRSARRTGTLLLAPDQAVVAVITPTGGKARLQHGTLLVDGRVVDYAAPAARR